MGISVEILTQNSGSYLYCFLIELEFGKCWYFIEQH